MYTTNNGSRLLLTIAQIWSESHRHPASPHTTNRGQSVQPVSQLAPRAHQLLAPISLAQISVVYFTKLILKIIHRSSAPLFSALALLLHTFFMRRVRLFRHCTHSQLVSGWLAVSSSPWHVQHTKLHTMESTGVVVMSL